MRLADWHQRYIQQAQWSLTVRRHLLAQLSFNPEDLLIEIGCGTGALLSEMRDRYASRHVGMDLDLDALRFAASVIPRTDLACADALNLPLADRTVSLAYCHYLLLWVADPAKVLREAWRVLKPGGWMMIFAEPDYGGRIDYPAMLERDGNLQVESLLQQGADTLIGRRLLELLVNAAFQEPFSAVMAGEWQPGSLIAGGLEQSVLQNDLARLGQQPAIMDDTAALKAAIRFVPTFYAAGKKSASA